MTWAILVALIVLPIWVNRVPPKHPTGHFCRPQMMYAPLSLRKYSEGGRDGDRDWCTGDVKRGRWWVPSNDLIDDSWCASEQERVGDRCLSKKPLPSGKEGRR